MSDWDLAADVYRLDFRLAREDGGDWRVIGARDRTSAERATR